MLLLFYDIKVEYDPHGARIRLVRKLRSLDAIHLQRSTWLVSDIPPELLELLDEIRALGGVILISEWRPIHLNRFREIPLVRLGPGHIVGVAVHGPEIVDTGEARKIIEFLEGTRAHVKAALGGTMGRTAILDAELDCKINIKRRIQPSQLLDEFAKDGADVVILLNHGKTIDTGIALGMEVFENARLIHEFDVPIIQIESPGELGGSIISWTDKTSKLAEWLGSELNLEIRQPPLILKRVKETKDTVYRKISGAIPGEKILVNGVVIGGCTHMEVTIVAQNGKIVDIIGGWLDEHGLEKLGKVNLSDAMIKTAQILRRTEPSKKALIKKPRAKKALLLERAEKSIDLAQQSDLVITVGDDTTAIAGEILSRFEIPVIGLVDCDAEGLIYGIHKKASAKDIANVATPGSVIIRLKPGTDDEAGTLIRDTIFGGRDSIEIRGKAGVERLKSRILKSLKNYILEVIAT